LFSIKDKTEKLPRQLPIRHFVTFSLRATELIATQFSPRRPTTQAAADRLLPFPFRAGRMHVFSRTVVEKSSKYYL
jgi:hypothetical protein